MVKRESGEDRGTRPFGRSSRRPDRTISERVDPLDQESERESVSGVEAAWHKIAASLRDSLGQDRFDRWFSAIRLLSDDGETVTFGVPNLFIEGWIRQRYRSHLELGVGLALGRREVQFKVDGQLFQQFRREEAQFLEAQRDSARQKSTEDAELKAPVVTPNPATESGFCSSSSGESIAELGQESEAVVSRPEIEARFSPSAKKTAPARTPASPKGEAETDQNSKLNEVLTLDSYVVGSCNHVAFNAGMEVLRQPGRSYNPLFVYGDSGLGKTHLLQGLTREYFRQGVREIRYLPCEEFVNRFVRSVQAREIDKFRRRFHRLKVLVLDDVHVLQSKPQSQIELLHAIDAIASAGGQVVLASDSRPNGIAKLQKQLLGRFVSGLVCRIQAPDYPTRLAILRREAMARGVDVPEEVRHAIARQHHKNVRELIGALVRVIASTTLLGAPLSEASALEALQDEAWSGSRPVTLERILEVQASRHGLAEAEFKSRSRARSISLARQEAMYLARVLTDHSLAEIGRFFGGRNHATVNFAFQKVRTRMNEESSYQQAIETAVRRLRG